MILSENRLPTFPDHAQVPRFSKFVSCRNTSGTNFEKQRGTSNTMITVPLFDLTLPARSRRSPRRNISSLALEPERKQTLAGLSNPKYHRNPKGKEMVRLTVSSAVCR
jgi:hypothetical protein